MSAASASTAARARRARARTGFFEQVADDFRAILANDPAARGPLAGVEVALTYPGFHAILVHRITHRIWRIGVPLLPRVMQFFNRFITGVDVHPAARIQGGLFIDHASGVVIGETAEVGRNCLIFHQVTLGGTGKETGKRHPTLGDNVVVGGGAKVLGNITIGDNVYVGANSVVLKSVPPDCTVVGIPGRIVRTAGQRMGPGGHADEPAEIVDPVRDRLLRIEENMRRLADKVGEPIDLPQDTEADVIWGDHI